MRVFVIALIFCFPLISFAKAEPRAIPDWKYVEKRLRKEKFSSSFIKEMKKIYEPKHFEEVARLNVLLFLKKADYHGVQISEQAAEEVRIFSRENEKALKAATKAHKVPSNVIASLIWLESRHGKNLGNFHVPSVYLHLLQVKRKPVLRYLTTQTYRFTERLTGKQRKEIPIRAERKIQFALGELKALEKVHKWKWKLGADFRGSFAGAFGMPQFIPSSYVRYARAMKPAAQPNLMRADDSIMSVAHYLKVHGWKSNSPEARVNALMKYNNSRDYANAILNLADSLEQRSTASAKK